MLAKTVNDNAKNLTPRAALGFFASKLAPTFKWRCANDSRWWGSPCSLPCSHPGSSRSAGDCP
ncbi:hypothetical protein C1Y30_30025 [Pseudomonas sp. GW704-F3]|nr:hypothetical protein C1Y30_30025 [Pseudomonas sp. GW704-F3]